jgi:hypothetical protein
MTKLVGVSQMDLMVQKADCAAWLGMLRVRHTGHSNVQGPCRAVALNPKSKTQRIPLLSGGFGWVSSRSLIGVPLPEREASPGLVQRSISLRWNVDPPKTVVKP